MGGIVAEWSLVEEKKQLEKKGGRKEGTPHMAALKSQFARSSIELRKKKKQNRKPDLRPGRIVAYCSNVVFAVCFLSHRCNPAHLNHIL